MAKYYSQTFEDYEIEIEPCRDKYIIRIDGLPVAFADTRQEADLVAEEVIKDLQLTPFPEKLQ